jgi:hypothetical protein
MEINNSILISEINDVFNYKENKSNFSWAMDIIVPGIPDQNVMKVFGLTINRDYISNFADEITCTVSLNLGYYARKLYPNRSNFKVRLYKQHHSLTNSSSNKELQVDIYKAYILTDLKSPTIAQGDEVNDERSLDLVSIVNIDLQLINPYVEKLRLLQVGGIYRQVTMDKLLLTLLTNEVDKLKNNNDQDILGVNLIPLSNKEVKDQVVVPHGTNIVNVPEYLQNTIGVNNTGIGSYIQDKHWYIYPLYDTSKYNDRLDTVTIIILPSNKFVNVENTYMKDRGTIKILVTGDTAYHDDNDVEYSNTGNGVRYTDPNKIFDCNETTVGNKITISKTKNNTEILDKVDTEVNYAPVSSNKITSNSYLNMSKLSEKSGGVIVVNWQNVDHLLLKPGMAVKILFEDNSKIKETYGTLLSAKYISTVEGNLISGKYYHQASLKIFVRKIKV